MEIAPAARLTDDGDTSVNAHPVLTLLNDHSSNDSEDNATRVDLSDAYTKLVGVNSQFECAKACARKRARARFK